MKIPIALDKDTHSPRLIANVERGAKCNCVCPGCLGALVAKKGEGGVSPHFAHVSGKHAQSCQESALHLLAKHWLLEKKCLQLPNFIVCLAGESLLGEPFEPAEYQFSERTILNNITSEQYLPELNIKPDILCVAEFFDTEYLFAIEIAVTHKVDLDKRNKMVGSGLSMLEINLEHLLKGNAPSMESVGTAINNALHSVWVHVCSDLKDKLYAATMDIGTTSWIDRDKKIIAWHASLQDYLRHNSDIYFPKYIFPKAVLDNSVIDINGKKHGGIILKPPSIGGRTFHVVHVGPILNKGFELTLGLGSGPVVVRVDLTHVSKFYHSDYQGVLRLTSILPPPQQFQEKLHWLTSLKAQRYLDECTTLKEKRKADIDQQIINKIDASWEVVFRYIRLENESELISPTGPPTDAIVAKCIATQDDLRAYGINLNEISAAVGGYWIFDCSYQTWQISLFGELLERHHITVPGALAILHTLGFKEIKEVKHLSIHKKLLKEINPDRASLLTTSYGVIRKYLATLEACGWLTKQQNGYVVHNPYRA